MKKTFFTFILATTLLTSTYSYAMSELDSSDFNEGWRTYSYTANIICGIFQFENAKENSPQAKLNAKLLETFLEYEAETVEALDTIRKNQLAEKGFPHSPFFTGEIKGTSEVYLNKDNIFSAKNEIYYHRGHGAFVSEEGINYKILKSDEIEKIEIEDLFVAGENWLDALLLEAINTIKETGEEKYLWDSDAKVAIAGILSYEKEDRTMSKQEYYISSFALKEDSLILIMQSLSIMPNSAGYPIIEIPFKRIKHLKELDFIK